MCHPHPVIPSNFTMGPGGTGPCGGNQCPNKHVPASNPRHDLLMNYCWARWHRDMRRSQCPDKHIPVSDPAIPHQRREWYISGIKYLPDSWERCDLYFTLLVTLKTYILQHVMESTHIHIVHVNYYYFFLPTHNRKKCLFSSLSCN